MKFLPICLLLFAITIERSVQRQLPSYLKPCKITVPNMNECIANVMNDVRPHLAEGVKELGVPPMKRLEIERLTFNLRGGTSNVTTTFEEVVFRGAEDFRVRNVNVDPTNGIFELAMLVPHFRSESKYRLAGRLVLLDLESAGDVAMNFTDVLIDAKYVGARYARDGREHFKFNVKSFDVTIGAFATEFQNLIEGNREITDAVNRSFNENADLILEQIKPVVSEAVEQLVTSVLNRAYSRYAIDELYPRD